jgi:hypothetical protein
MPGTIERGVEVGGRKPPGMTFDEFSYDFFIQANGRPMRERHADESVVDDAKNRGVVFNLVHCPYPDGRSEYPDKQMNASAWDVFRKSSPVVLGGLSFLNQEYFGQTPPQTTTVRQVTNLSAIAMNLCLYLANRGENPIDQENIPDEVGELFKVGQGLRSSAAILEKRLGLDAIVTPEDLYDAANDKTGRRDGRPILAGIFDESCAAPRSRIVQAGKALLYREEGKVSKSGLDTLFQPGEFTSAMEFSWKFDLGINTRAVLFDRINKAGSQIKTSIYTPELMDENDRFFFDLACKLEGRLEKEMRLIEIDINNYLGRDPRTLPPILV